MVYLRSKIYFLQEEKRVFQLFYSCELFQKCDLALKKKYRFLNPFTISKRFLKKREGEEIDIYGEIPLTSLLVIAKECEIAPYDHVFELGCGRGRAAFFLRSVLLCSVTAVDFIPFFVLNAQKIVEALNIKRLTFICDDIQHVALNQATCIYLYGTCLSDNVITQLCASLPAKIKIITLSYSLKDYHKGFKTIKQFTVPVPWGKIEVFLNQK
ncbi:MULTISPECIES: class I SAM-dependent methyltransferase [Candidatus Rhabdochlamydia]|nr:MULTISPECIES: class I SAM-dependent methyltransferase [Rhabdochlamydia]MCL6756092.1 class I SAM-dependent methyltransferase [Candidatus Rhabdochlamydia oedothoracis]